MECLSQSRRVVRVTSDHSVGYLYFRDGRIVHALTPDLIGERAALEILGWSDGSFEPCQLMFPKRDSIEVGYQDLLMRAVQQQDERARDSQPVRDNLLEFPTPLRGVQDSEVPFTTTSAFLPDPGEPLPRAVRVGSDGGVVSAYNAREEFAGVAAYAARLGSLIGEALGLTDLSRIEASHARGRISLRAAHGELVALEARDPAELEALRKAWSEP